MVGAITHDPCVRPTTAGQRNKTERPKSHKLIKKSRAVGPSKIKILSKNMREKPTNTPIIHSVY
jgi:hypothetical protein